MVLNLTFLEGRLIDLDFFVEKIRLSAPSNELSAQNIPFADH